MKLEKEVMVLFIKQKILIINYMLLKNESNHCFKGIPAGNYSDANRILHPCHEYCTLCKDSPTNCQECKSSYFNYR